MWTALYCLACGCNVPPSLLNHCIFDTLGGVGLGPGLSLARGDPGLGGAGVVSSGIQWHRVTQAGQTPFSAIFTFLEEINLLSDLSYLPNTMLAALTAEVFCLVQSFSPLPLHRKGSPEHSVAFGVDVQGAMSSGVVITFLEKKGPSLQFLLSQRVALLTKHNYSGSLAGISPIDRDTYPGSISPDGPLHFSSVLGGLVESCWDTNIRSTQWPILH